MAKKSKKAKTKKDVNAVPAVDADIITDESPLTAPEQDLTAAAADDAADQFRSPQNGDEIKIVEPIESSTADALTAIPHVRPALPEEDTDATAADADGMDEEVPAKKKKQKKEKTKTDKKPAIPGFKKRKRHPLMRFLGAIVPRMGDGAFDIVRKLIMLIGIIVFIGAATYLVDDLILIPYTNDVNSQMYYDWKHSTVLTEEEQSYQYYPEGMDSSFKKLYYHNNDVRGWLSYHSTDNSATIDIEYPIMQSADNDFYLFHDFNKTYNKNGALFFDYRNQFTSPYSFNYNTIVYGHNMASGQMFAKLNKFLYGVEYARTAPLITMDTLYKSEQYKVFAVMLLNNDPKDGNPFGYLRTQFSDVMDYADFLANIRARSLYDYNDVDVRPDDEILMLSTCNSYSEAKFSDGRTVVVARKLRAGESPSTDVNTIVRNGDVVMPYGWYVNQSYEPHPYYVDASYDIPQLDTLDSYLQSVMPESTTTTVGGVTTLPINVTTLPIGTTTTTTTTTTEVTTTTTTGTTSAYAKSLYVQYTPKVYRVGSAFDYTNTKIFVVYSDGTRKQVNTKHCAIEGFSTSSVGHRFVTVHYGELRAQFKIQVIAKTTAPTTVVTDPTETAPTTTTTTETSPTTQSTSTSNTLAPQTAVTELRRED